MRAPTHFLAIALTTLGLCAQVCPDSNLGAPLGDGDEVTFAIQPIGFAFPFAGTSYTNVHVCTNGYLSLSNSGVPTPNATNYVATTWEFVGGAPRVAPLWNDLDIRQDNGGKVFINSSVGRCTVTWKNAQNYNAGLGGGALFDLQVQLFPSGDIRMYYSAGAANNSSLAAGQPAIVGATAGGGVGLPAASDLSVAGSTGDGTVFEQWTTARTFDLNNNALLLSPTSPGWMFAPLGPPTNCASASTYGVGCGAGRDSFYELMGPGTFDLANTTLAMVRTPDGYVLLHGSSGTILSPASATIVANADDTQQTVSLTSAMPVPFGVTSALTIGSNGYIALSASGNGTARTPGVAPFLAWAQTAVAPSWHDYNPAAPGSGKIYFQELAGIGYVTWDNVYSFGSTAPNRFQVQFQLATGDITIVYGAMNAAGNGHLVGFSVAGESADPGSTNLSSPFGYLPVFDHKQPLALSLNSPPTLGNAGFALVTSNVPAPVPLAFVFVGDAQVSPGLDLTFLGMPGCFSFTNANLTSATFPVNPAAHSGSIAFPLPAFAGFAGTTLTCQSAAFSLDTPLNLINSNGAIFTIGY